MPQYPRLSVPRFSGRGRGPLVRLLPAPLPACVPISFESPPVPPESLGPSVRPSVPTPSPRPSLPGLCQSFTLRMPLRPTPIPRRPPDVVLREPRPRPALAAPSLSRRLSFSTARPKPGGPPGLASRPWIPAPPARCLLLALSPFSLCVSRSLSPSVSGWAWLVSITLPFPSRPFAPLSPLPWWPVQGLVCPRPLRNPDTTPLGSQTGEGRRWRKAG